MMNTLHDNETRLYRFLLDELPPAELESLEIRLLTDDDLQTQVAAAEFDLIDDYQRGALTAAEHTRFEQHFLNSPERRSKLMTAQAFLDTTIMAETPNQISNVTSLKEFVERKQARQLRNWKLPLALAASVLLLLSLSAIIYRVFFSASPAEQGLALLQRAYRNERPLEARVSGFAYAPFVQTRGANDTNNNGILREQAASELRRAVIAQPDAKAQHALGNYYLLEGKFADAIKQLEESLKTDPNNAQLHNDLGVALLETAKLEKQQADRGAPTAGESLKTLARANEHFAQALQIDGTLPAAQFNQALCLGYLGLVNQATEAWQKYLQLDAASEWANEARRKLEELEEQKKKMTRNNEQIVREYLAACQTGDTEQLWQAFTLGREAAGNIITTRLLDEYLELVQQGKAEEASQRLHWLAQAAALEAQKGDLFTQDLLNLYRNINPSQRALSVEARRLFKEAGKLESEKDTAALPLYQQARSLFKQSGNQGEAALVTLRIIRIENLLYHFQVGRSEAEALRAFATDRRYAWLQAKAHSGLASLHLTLKEYSLALAHNKQALRIFANLSDPQSEFSTLVQQAMLAQRLGNPEQALGQLARPFELGTRYPTGLNNQRFMYSTASDCFQKLQLLFTAIACQREALACAQALHNLLLQSRSYAYIGELYGELNRLPEAIAQVEQARAIGQSQAETAGGQDIIEHALLRLGHLYRQQGDWQQALSYYDECLQLSDRLQKDYDRLNIHRGKLLVHLARHETTAAQLELQAALQLFEQNTANITQEGLRNSFFDTGQEIYDLALQFAAVNQHDPEQAFNFSERSRARTLLDLLRDQSGDRQPANANELTVPASAKPLSLAEIRQQMPASVQLVQYALLNDKLLIWVVSRASFQSSAQPIRLSDFNAQVTAYLECLKQGTKAESQVARQLAEQLYGLLIAPIAEQLDASKELWIVPDESLNYLPFGALLAPQTQQYLIQTFTISYAPSATVFLACTDNASKKAAFSAEHCLSVGHPLFDQENYPQLADLPATEREALQVAKYYPAARVLLGGNASESAFRREAQGAEVIQIASHSLVNTQKPEYSGILLAQEAVLAPPAADGMLYAGEVLRMRLPRTKLVILSACQTMLGHNYRGEGMVGLARAFIVADVPLVVASLWAVDSEATAELMNSFHAYRQQAGFSTARALREAQLKMLRQPKSATHSPNVWAAFVPVGGFTRY